MVYMNVLGRSYLLLNDPDDIKVFKYLFLCWIFIIFIRHRLISCNF